MATAPINANAPVQYYGQQSGTEARLPVQTLGQQDFLKLLIAQMTSQDPLNPKTDMEMIPQMVQFTALEQTKTMQADIATLQANSLLGRTVELQEDGLPTTVTGQVTAVQMKEGMPQLVVSGRTWDLKNVLSITPAPAG
jgi:flagellar basal-body rod modification protein FlgD